MNINEQLIEMDGYLKDLQEFNQLPDNELINSKNFESLLKTNIKHFIKRNFDYISFLPDSVENELKELQDIYFDIEKLIDFKKLKEFKPCLENLYYFDNPEYIDAITKFRVKGICLSDALVFYKNSCLFNFNNESFSEWIKWLKDRKTFYINVLDFNRTQNINLIKDFNKLENLCKKLDFFIPFIENKLLVEPRLEYIPEFNDLYNYVEENNVQLNEKELRKIINSTIRVLEELKKEIEIEYVDIKSIKQEKIFTEKENNQNKKFENKKELPKTLNYKQKEIVKFVVKNPIESTRKYFGRSSLPSLRSNDLNPIYSLFPEFSKVPKNSHSKYEKFQEILKNYNLDN